MKKIYVPKTVTFRERLMRDVLRRASAVAEETPRVCINISPYNKQNSSPDEHAHFHNDLTSVIK